MPVKTLFLLLMAAALYCQENVAVLELEADGVTASEAKTLTNKLRGELISTGQFTVIERGQMDEILKEQGFQQTGCTSEACGVEVGQLLGVKSIIAGSIGKVGTIFLISLRQIDVAKGSIIKPADQEVEGDVAEVLRHGLHDVARKIAGLLPDHAPPPPKKSLPPAPPKPAYQTTSMGMMVKSTSYNQPQPADQPPSQAQSPSIVESQTAAQAFNKRHSRHSISIAYGKSVLDLRSFHWQQKDSFDIEYKGLKWNAGNHFEFDGAPMLMYGDLNSSSVMFRNELGINFDKSVSAASQATVTDSSMPIPTAALLPEGSFRMNRFGIIDKLDIGAAIRIPSITLEPYLGIDIQFDFDAITGKAVWNRSLMTQYLRFGFPLGIRLCFDALFVGFEYVNFFKSIQLTDGLDVSDSGKSITGGFSDEGDAYWAIHIGRIF